MRSSNISIPVNRAGVFIVNPSTEIPSPRARSGLTGLVRFSNEHNGIFTKEIVGGRDLVQPGSYEQALEATTLPLTDAWKFRGLLLHYDTII